MKSQHLYPVPRPYAFEGGTEIKEPAGKLRPTVEPPSPARPHQRSSDIDDVVARGGRILPVPGDTEPDLEVDPLTFFSSNPRFGRSCVHSGTKPMPRPAETSDTSENVSSQV